MLLRWNVKEKNVLLVIGPVQDPAFLGSKFKGFAGKDCEQLEVSVFPPLPQGLRRGKQCFPLPLRSSRFAVFSFFAFLTPET
jgi:hypothetical protein